MQQDLGQCVLRQKPTLKELALHDGYLEGGDWQACFSMFAGKVLQLELVRLDEPLVSFDADKDEDIVIYLGHSLDSRSRNDERSVKLAKWIIEGTGEPRWRHVDDNGGVESSEGEHFTDSEKDEDDDISDDSTGPDTDSDGMSSSESDAEDDQW